MCFKWNCLSCWPFANSFFFSLGCSYRKESALVGFMFRYLDQTFLIPTLHSLIVATLLSFSFLPQHLKFDLLKWKELVKDWNCIKVSICVYHTVFVAMLILKQRSNFCSNTSLTLHQVITSKYHRCLIPKCYHSSPACICCDILLPYVLVLSMKLGIFKCHTVYPLWITQASQSFKKMPQNYHISTAFQWNDPHEWIASVKNKALRLVTHSDISQQMLMSQKKWPHYTSKSASIY